MRAWYEDLDTAPRVLLWLAGHAFTGFMTVLALYALGIICPH